MIYRKKCKCCETEMTYIPNETVEQINLVEMDCEVCGVSYLVPKFKLRVEETKNV